MSRRTLVFLVLYFGSFVFMAISPKYVLGEDFYEMISDENVLETLSVGSTNGICGVAILFPLFLARGLDTTDLRWVSAEQLPFPKHGVKTIFSYFGSIVGSIIFMLGYLLQLGQPYEFILKIITYQFVGNCHHIRIITVPDH